MMQHSDVRDNDKSQQLPWKDTPTVTTPLRSRPRSPDPRARVPFSKKIGQIELLRYEMRREQL
jgi:hypothetical protein